MHICYFRIVCETGPKQGLSRVGPVRVEINKEVNGIAPKPFTYVVGYSLILFT